MHSVIISKSGTVSLNLNGQLFSFAPEHPNYPAIVEAINEENESEMEKLTRKDEICAATSGKVSYIGGVVRWNGSKIDNAVSRRIIELDNKGHSVTFILNFLEKCYQNPDPTVVDRLYLFLENSCIHIDSNGDIIGYKKVDENGWDYKTHTIQYKVGGIVTLNRNRCDSNSFNTCSGGLNIGSLIYARDLWHPNQGKILILKVNPADVVCIPEETGWYKMRACRLEVLAEYKDDKAVSNIVYHDFSAKRDSRGRFIAGNKNVARDVSGRFAKKSV